MWKRLQHPNVVPFLGFGSIAPPFSLVYPWVSNGGLSDYAREHPDADKLDLVSGYPYRSGGPCNDLGPPPPPAVGRRSRVDLPAPV